MNGVEIARHVSILTDILSVRISGRILMTEIEVIEVAAIQCQKEAGRPERMMAAFLILVRLCDRYRLSQNDLFEMIRENYFNQPAETADIATLYGLVGADRDRTAHIRYCARLLRALIVFVGEK